MIAASQPLFQAPPFLVERGGADDSDFRETLGACAFFDRVRRDCVTNSLLVWKHSGAGLKTHPPMITDYFAVGSFWIVIVIIGVSPAVRLYATQ